jgi:hypothetical protein
MLKRYQNIADDNTDTTRIMMGNRTNEIMDDVSVARSALIRINKMVVDTIVHLDFLFNECKEVSRLLRDQEKKHAETAYLKMKSGELKSSIKLLTAIAPSFSSLPNWRHAFDSENSSSKSLGDQQSHSPSTGSIQEWLSGDDPLLPVHASGFTDRMVREDKTKDDNQKKNVARKGVERTPDFEINQLVQDDTNEGSTQVDMVCTEQHAFSPSRNFISNLQRHHT